MEKIKPIVVMVFIIVGGILILDWESKPYETRNERVMEQIVAEAAETAMKDLKQSVLFSVGGRDEAKSFYGGVPTRFEGEYWPTNYKTGKPLSFVVQIAKTDLNAEYMGEVELLRVFLDYDSNMDYPTDTGEVQILITESNDVPPLSRWDDDEIADLEFKFGDTRYASLIFPRRPLSEKIVETANSASIEKAYKKHHIDNFELWWDVRVNAIKLLKQKRPELMFAEDVTVLGGNPSWVQYEETFKQPFFLQLYPDREDMVADGGHLYIFLDKKRPSRGLHFVIQSH